MKTIEPPWRKIPRTIELWRRRRRIGWWQNNKPVTLKFYIIVKHCTVCQFASTFDWVDMSWSCPVCQNDFSRKDRMPRHMSSKHANSGFPSFQARSISPEKCQRFHLVHPFTCMIAGMTGTGKTLWVKSLIEQAQNTIHLPPERIVWCYSQWQPAYSELSMTIPGIEFVKGIPSTLEQDSYFDVNIRNLIIIDDQMIEAGNDNRVVNLFTKGLHYRNLSVIYIVQNLFNQGKGNRNFSLRTFARKSSNTDFVLKLSPVWDYGLRMSKIWKNWRVIDFVSEIWCPKDDPKSEKSGFVSAHG